MKVNDVRERIGSDLDPSEVIPPASLQVRVVYPTLERELCVAGVYVRVFNEQPEFELFDPAGFMKGLVELMQDKCVLFSAKIVQSFCMCPDWITKTAK